MAYFVKVGPLFDNAIGHCAGVAVFSLLFYLFLIDWRRSDQLRSGLSAIAAALALLWSVGDLFALAPGLTQGIVFHVLHTVSFLALSVLPAVLLQMWLQGRCFPLRHGGYFVSFAAAILHIWEHLRRVAHPHDAALSLIAIGFGALTVICVLQRLVPPRPELRGWHLAASMLLLLPAIFFVYYDTSRAGHFHHTGILLSLLVVLFDYRFLLLDAFLRLLLRSILAAGGAFWVLAAQSRFHFLEQDQFYAALAYAGVFVTLMVLLHLSRLVERLFIRLLAGRRAAETVLATLRDFPTKEHSDEDYLDHARQAIEVFFECDCQFRDHPQVPGIVDLPGPVVLLERWKWPVFNTVSWAEAALPLQFHDGDGRLLLLGSRRGKRRYGSADLLLLGRFGKVIETHVERRRQLHTQASAAHAELRALQAQINPHFFFNSLNTLYGAIARDNVEARRLVLNLAEVFHYLLRSDRTFVSFKQELGIINAYLEIEKLRLGSRLTTCIQIDEFLLKAEIPVLSIQPLVENAVKHGVAPYGTKGFVGIVVKAENTRLTIEVTNTGRFGSHLSLNGAGVGLENVRRRLFLCYGFEAELHISCKENLTRVWCCMPLSIPVSEHRARPAKEKHWVGQVPLWARPLES